MKTILVADDDRGMARTVCDILRRHGWTPTEVHSGEAAVEAAATRRFAAVLMDVRMPGINGVEAFRVIREAQPQTPVILMTAYAAPELLSQAEREGVLQHPAEAAAVGHAVRPARRRSARSKAACWSSTTTRRSSRRWRPCSTRPAGRVRRATTIDEAVQLLAERPPRVGGARSRAATGCSRATRCCAIRRVNPAVVLILCSGHTQLMDETLSALPPGSVYRRPDQAVSARPPARSARNGR